MHYYEEIADEEDLLRTVILALHAPKALTSIFSKDLQPRSTLFIGRTEGTIEYTSYFYLAYLRWSSRVVCLGIIALTEDLDILKTLPNKSG